MHEIPDPNKPPPSTYWKRTSDGGVYQIERPVSGQPPKFLTDATGNRIPFPTKAPPRTRDGNGSERSVTTDSTETVHWTQPDGTTVIAQSLFDDHQRDTKTTYERELYEEAESKQERGGDEIDIDQTTECDPMSGD